MTEEVKVSPELIERLITRIEALEKKLEVKEEKDKKKKKKKGKKKSTAQKVADSVGDATSDIIKDTGKIISGMVDASVEGMKQSADALTSLSEETDKEKLGEIPAAIVSIFRKTIDIQKKALDKFEERCEECDEDDD